MIIKFTVAFMLAGLVVSFLLPVEYQASCKLMPEDQEGTPASLGGLGSLAGLAGISLDMGSGGILTPTLYPELAQSLTFRLKMVNSPVFFEEKDTTLSSYAFFKEVYTPSVFALVERYTVGLPGLIKKAFTDDKKEASKDAQLLRLSRDDTKLIEAFSERIDVNVDINTSIISVSVKMPDPHAAAELTNLVVTQLTDDIIHYKTEKAKSSLQFIQERFDESKKEFETRQEDLAAFTDRNRNISSSVAQMELQRLQNQYNIAFEVYKSLASQLEQAKIKVKEQTPVFTTLDPVVIPADNSEPNKPLIIVAFTLLGGFVALGYVFLSGFWSKLVSEINK